MSDPTTEDLLAEHEAAGGTDPEPVPVEPGDPDYVEAASGCTPVEPEED